MFIKVSRAIFLSMMIIQEDSMTMRHIVPFRVIKPAFIVVFLLQRLNSPMSICRCISSGEVRAHLKRCWDRQGMQVWGFLILNANLYICDDVKCRLQHG